MYVRRVTVFEVSRSNESEKRKSFAIALLSSAVQGSNFVSSSAPYSGGRAGGVAAHLLAPAAYAAGPSGTSADEASRLPTAARLRPSVLSWTSWGSASGPRSSASVPDAVRRLTSI